MTEGVSNPLAATGNSTLRRSYQSEGTREVQSRARFIEQAQTPQEQAGVQRLDRLLRDGGQPDPAAPRGFYLNINV